MGNILERVYRFYGNILHNLLSLHHVNNRKILMICSIKIQLID